MKIGFIGLGNMATAIIGGMLKQGICTPGEITGTAHTEETAQKVAKEFGIITFAGHNQDVALKSDLLFLAVKPQVLPEVLKEIKFSILPETLVVSIVAGKDLAYLAKELGPDTRIIRCMPNTPALVGEGCTAICANDHVNSVELEQVRNIFNSFGKGIEVPEKWMDAVVGVSGSGPAYVFMFIEAMADAAVQQGMPRKQAYEFAAQTVLGSARMVLETGKHPGELKDMVCSPAGTTIEAVKVLEEKNFRGAVMDAVIACAEKSRNL
ncbi:MAG: pyrroline-5-carboxylate reductase [Lachnospiraceae bacterium]|nr:pyrroline-5-carboxylate reductase [Lachnospiraceae bacterium]